MDSRGIGTRERGRRIANYLSKYLSKDVGEDHATGAHRYERSQGFNVRVVKRTPGVTGPAVSVARYRGRLEAGEMKKWIMARVRVP